MDPTPARLKTVPRYEVSPADVPLSVSQPRYGLFSHFFWIAHMARPRRRDTANMPMPSLRRVLLPELRPAAPESAVSAADCGALLGRTCGKPVERIDELGYRLRERNPIAADASKVALPRATVRFASSS